MILNRALVPEQSLFTGKLLKLSYEIMAFSAIYSTYVTALFSGSDAAFFGFAQRIV